MSELLRVSVRVSFTGGADGEDGMDVDADDGKSPVFFSLFFPLTVFFAAGPSTSRAGRLRKLKPTFRTY
jgi:hypothetical protein